MKRYSSSILLLLLPCLVWAKQLDSTSGVMGTNNGDVFKTLKAVYDTDAKTLKIYNFVGSGGQVYGAENSQYPLVFENVYEGSKEAEAASTPADASGKYYYSSSWGAQRSLWATVFIDGNTMTLQQRAPEGISAPNLVITELGSYNYAPGTTSYSLWNFEFTFPGLEDVVGSLSLSANFTSTSSNSAQLNYSLNWVMGDAPANISEYKVTVAGNNGFQTVQNSVEGATGTLSVSSLKYATPYTFTVSAQAVAGGETYNSNEVIINLPATLAEDLAIAIKAPEESEMSNSVEVEYTITAGNVTAGTPFTVNIVGDNGFEVFSKNVGSDLTGKLTLTGLRPGIHYNFSAQVEANVGDSYYVFSPVDEFSVLTEGTPSISVEAEAEAAIKDATITGTVTVGDGITEPVKVYYTPTVE